MTENPRIEIITPSIARRYLSTQFKNRKFRKEHMEQLKKAMEDGTFLYSGDSIRFNSLGELIDGQHRLTACIESGKSFRAVIVTDIPQESIDVIDTGLKRTQGDIFEIQGYTDGNNLAAALRWLWRYENDYMTSYPRKPQISELKEVWEKHPKIKDSLYIGAQVSKLIVRALGSALHCLFNERDPRAANNFFEFIIKGEGLYKGEPEYWLRKRLVENSQRKAKLPYYEIAAITIKAFNAYREGKKFKYLRWMNEGENKEEFPKIL